MSRDDLVQPRRPAPRLGPLEMAVLDVLWADGARGVSDVHRKVGDPRGLSRNTIQSTLERLVRKRLAARRKKGRAYEYRALLSRTDWIARSLAAVLDALPGDDPAQLLASFVEASERVGADQLAALERSVRERRGAQDRPARRPEREDPSR